MYELDWEPNSIDFMIWVLIILNKEEYEEGF
jgi:hypothetical protein